MKLVVINPNSTQSMTDKIVAAARLAVGADVQIVGRTAHGARPASRGISTRSCPPPR